MGCFLGIDIGASYIKGAVFDLDKRTIGSIKKISSPMLRIRKLHSKSSYLRFETDPLLYVSKTKRLINVLNKLSKKSIEGVVFSSQMHGTVLIGDKSKPITPFIGWQDERLLENIPGKTVSGIDLLKQKLSGINTSSTGITLRSGIMGATLFWLNQIGFLQKHPGAKALYIGDFVALALTNGEAVVEPTQACGSGLFDVKKRSWSMPILAATGIPTSVLPKVVPVNYAVGTYSSDGKSIPVYVSVGDLQAAVLGSLVRIEKDLNINIGTGSQVSYVRTSFKSGDYDIRSFFESTYLYTITHLPAGRALNVITGFFEDGVRKLTGKRKNIHIWEMISKTLERKNSSEGLEARISFYKNNATGFSSGFIENVTEKNWTIENMLFAAYGNMAKNYKWAYERFKFKKLPSSIVCSGGIIRKSNLLRRLLSKEFNQDVNLAPYEEETLTGLFILSLVCRGDYKNVLDAAASVKKEKLEFL